MISKQRLNYQIMRMRDDKAVKKNSPVQMEVVETCWRGLKRKQFEPECSVPKLLKTTVECNVCAFAEQKKMNVRNQVNIPKKQCPKAYVFQDVSNLKVFLNSIEHRILSSKNNFLVLP